MRIPNILRNLFVASLVLAAALGASFETARAETGTIQLTILKGGWIIGGSGGRGTLTFQGKTYKLGVGGLDYGLIFGGSKTVLHGTVKHISKPSDVEGVYAAAGAGLAVGSGVRAIVLTNPKGAVLQLEGRQVGLMANADLSGLAISLK
ncbi:hypothetical protein V6C03_00460 [Methyloligella sp. 2.7D]|uniref:hypothetical protein n=1 Tax=unclassified Methyloligella TaxID=2625955 RepID=UPI00157DB44D|nr:hypothetical protein [Methyloligella sp. GL2]QKP76856.1 hypothetical protein HT051_04955 [Methyloligella sp. GL2]